MLLDGAQILVQPGQGLSVQPTTQTLVTGADQAAEGVADDPGGDERRDLGVVVRWGAFDDLDAGERPFGHQLNELQYFARQKAAGLGPSGSGHERRVQAVDVKR